ncbi:UDP-4-amino-4,6-dideoxy-N-acetyl-beta-L-altrosamine transaminase, partial [Amylibacter sp.]|nr:UDP-4-amino-4,6-dideoxy-N-acetyl-beta-L-altrosamine transaminase [Amylibacter sp.]
MINYGKQDIQQEDIDAVCDVLRSDFLTQGPSVPKFEKTIRDFCGVNFAVAVNSATSALHVALLSLDVGTNDYVWTTSNTFVASANCALYCGAKIDFVDIDETSYNMCIKALEQKLVKSQNEGKLPKVVIPVHLTGQPCDMRAIYNLSKKYNFKIVEDASHAIGSTYHNKNVGSCEFSDITIFSFHPVKIITTGEGGVALTKSKSLHTRLELFRSHGITRNPELMERSISEPWYYEQIELGFNYRMTDIHAALGISQMGRIKEFIKKRNNISVLYNRELLNLPITLPKISKDTTSSHHLYVIRLNLNKIAPLTHKMVFEELRRRGIGVNLHYIPVHSQPYYQKLGFKWGDFPQA